MSLASPRAAGNKAAFEFLWALPETSVRGGGRNGATLLMPWSTKRRIRG